MYACAPHECSCFWRFKSRLDPTELELQMVAGHRMDSEPSLQPLQTFLFLFPPSFIPSSSSPPSSTIATHLSFSWFISYSRNPVRFLSETRG